MDQSCSNSELSMSPYQFLEQLKVIQNLAQRHRLVRHYLESPKSPETSNSTEIVSHFSGSTSYNTFRSLLQSSGEKNHTENSRQNPSTSNIYSKVQENDLPEGVALLNLSHEFELPINSSPSSRSPSKQTRNRSKKIIELDDMPILSPNRDFQAMVLEKLSEENVNADMGTQTPRINKVEKKSFLRRGEGTARFGLKKDDLVIQNTSTLPWKKRYCNTSSSVGNIKKKYNKKVDSEVQINIVENKKPNIVKIKNTKKSMPEQNVNMPVLAPPSVTLTNCDAKTQTLSDNNKNSQTSPGKRSTRGSIFTKEQDNYLRQLKQSTYYKNFASPTKSEASDMSCNEDFLKVKGQKEMAEQHMFDLLEKKAAQDSFNLDNSFLFRFLKRAQLENSGDSTPMILQKCIAEKPELLQIFSGFNNKENFDESVLSFTETCSSQCMECDQQSTTTSTTTSSCSTCKTVESRPNTIKEKDGPTKNLKNNIGNKFVDTVKRKAEENISKDGNKKNNCQSVLIDESIKTNMVEMNSKLMATSEILQARLKELEDEIETFRKENSNLVKMREEVDLEKHKFYEEKSSFEQKFNEEKILAEYHLAEEKEKLVKQKQIYERYVREMRGRLNKKDKDEVIGLKNEISRLKEEIRVKDAKSTCTIARLRNHIKILEKEKMEQHEVIEKLKKDHSRLQHSNEMTRRLTNIKYLEEVNKKLHSMSNHGRPDVSSDNNIKYKAFEIEKQSKKRTAQTTNPLRTRAKSVPNLNITSRYAKYFSQRDAASQIDKDNTIHVERYNKYLSDDEFDKPDGDKSSGHNESYDQEDSILEEANNLEKIYRERFQSSENSNNCSNKSSPNSVRLDEFFISKSISRTSYSPIRDLSPDISISRPQSRSKSPVSILSNKIVSNASSTKTLQSQPRTVTPEHQNLIPNYPSQMIASQISCNTNVSKTTITPTEVIKPDGSKEIRFPNGNVKHISADGKYSKFVYYNGDVKENFYNEGRIKYFYSETKTFHTTHRDGMETLEFPDGQIEKRYSDGSSEVRLPNGSVRYHDPKNKHVREEWRFPDGTRLTMAANGEQRVEFANGQVEVHTKDHKRREFPDGTVKLVYNDGTSETRYASGRVRVKDKHGNLIMDSAPR